MVTKRKASTGQRDSKRLKEAEELTEAKQAASCAIADALFSCGDIVSDMLSFLDVRTLLRFVCVSKEFKYLLTYNNVVRVTMLTGGFPEESLERMIPPIRARSIWIPSPLRLLRVVCGKKCEHCSKKTRYVWTSFGVFLCRKCTENNTKRLQKGERWNPYFQAPRVQLGPRQCPRNQHIYLIKKPLRDVNGDTVGPLVTSDDIETMEQEVNESLPVERVRAFVEKCNTQQPQAEANARAILRAFEDNREDAVVRRQAIKFKKENVRGRLGEAREKKSNELVGTLICLLDHDPKLIEQLKERQWSPIMNQYVFHQDSIVRKILTPVFKAPSKYSSRKKLRPIADEIQLRRREKQLMEQYLRQIVEYCGHPDANINRRLLRWWYESRSFSYRFSSPNIRNILEKPLSKPRSLSEEDVQQLADRVKSVALRREPGEAIVRKLERRLQDTLFVEDLGKRNWNTWTWSWTFVEPYIQALLQEPLLKPNDITDEMLDDLEQQVRAVMDNKKVVIDKMELLLKPIEAYPTWKAKLDKWTWYPKQNRCRFLVAWVNQTVCKRFENMDMGQEFSNSNIQTISKDLLAEVERRESDSSLRFGF